MNEIGLKPCPFCGVELEYSFLLGASKCKGCGVMIGFPKLTRHEDKIIATNTRAPMANIVEKLEELKEKGYAELTMLEVNELIDNAINIVKQEMNNGENNT